MARNYRAIHVFKNKRVDDNKDHCLPALSKELELDIKYGWYGKGRWLYIPRDASLGGL